MTSGTSQGSVWDQLLGPVVDYVVANPANLIGLAPLGVLAWFVVPAIFQRIERAKEMGKQSAKPPAHPEPAIPPQPVLSLPEMIAAAMAGGPVTALTDKLNDAIEKRVITEQAVKSFLATLGAKDVPVADWPAKLNEIASAHVRLLDDFSRYQAFSPQAQALRSEAETAAIAGRRDEADALLVKARDTQTGNIAHLKLLLAEQLRSAARIEVERALNAQADLDHAKAAACFVAAADLLPAGDKRQQMVLLDEAAREYLILGATEAAAVIFERIHALAHKRYDQMPNDAEAQRDLSVSLSRTGNIRLRLGNAQGALEAYEESLAISQTLATSDPANAEAQRDLSVSLNKIGDIRLRLGDVQGALAAYEQDLAISQILATGDPANAEAQRDLSVSLNKIGDTRLRRGDALGALEVYERGLVISQTLATGDPANAEAQRDLFVSLNRIGNTRLRLDDAQGALEAYEQSLAISQTLATSDPNNVGALQDLAISHVKLAELSLTDRRAHARAILAIVEPLLAAGKTAEYLARLKEIAESFLADAPAEAD